MFDHMIKKKKLPHLLSPYFFGTFQDYTFILEKRNTTRIVAVGSSETEREDMDNGE